MSSKIAFPVLTIESFFIYTLQGKKDDKRACKNNGSTFVTRDIFKYLARRQAVGNRVAQLVACGEVQGWGAGG